MPILSPNISHELSSRLSVIIIQIVRNHTADIQHLPISDYYKNL